MVEQTDGSYNNPYKFNAKELDEDTGLYYYGARYYNPRLSIWYGVDPLAEEFTDWSPYNYTFNNPVRYTDPDGKAPEDGVENCCSGFKGFALAVADNITGGNLAQRYNDGTASYNKGVSNGNIASAITGALLVADGSGNIGGGGATLAASEVATASVVGAEVGVPGMIIGGGMILKGTIETAVGGVMMHNASKNIKSNNSLNFSKTGSGRGSNNRTADPDAVGDHTVTNNNGSTTYKVNQKKPNKNNKGVGFETQKRVDYKGTAHVDKKTGAKTPTPHVQQNGTVRKAIPGKDMPKKI